MLVLSKYPFPTDCIPKAIPLADQIRMSAAFHLDRTRYENHFRSIIIENWLSNFPHHSYDSDKEDLSKDIEKWQQLNKNAKKELDPQTCKDINVLCNHSIQQRKALLQKCNFFLEEIPSQLQNDTDFLSMCQQLIGSKQAIEAILNTTKPGETEWHSAYQNLQNELEKQREPFFGKMTEIRKNKQVQPCNEYWGEQTQEILRLFRTLSIYQLWQTKSKQQSDGIEKKAFFIQALKEENIIQILNALTLMIDQNPDLKNPKKALRYFDNEIQLIRRKEERHLSIQLATILGPTYKIAMEGFDIGYESIDHLESAQGIYNTIDAIGNKFMPSFRFNPETIKKMVQHLMSLFCFYLCIIRGASSWTDYLYLASAMIIQIVFSQFDACVSAGQAIEKVLSPANQKLTALTPIRYRGVVDAITRQCRLDEIGLLEKEAKIQWLSGLILYWVLCGKKYVIPYTAATASATVSDIFIDQLINQLKQYKQCNPEGFKKTIQHVMSVFCFYLCVRNSSSLMDYFYLAAAPVIQILFSQFNGCIKETKTQWLLGLIPYWILCDKTYLMPITLNYIATTMAAIAISQHKQWDKIAMLGKHAIHTGVYRYSFRVNMRFFQPEEKTTAQALNKLNLSEDASNEKIRKSYYKIALKCHPDKNNHCEQDFMEATQAYEHLQSLKTKSK